MTGEEAQNDGGRRGNDDMKGRDYMAISKPVVKGTTHA